MVSFERAQIEALLFATDLPLTPSRIAEILVMPVGRVERELEILEEHYKTNGHSITVAREGTGVRLRTRPEFADLLVAVRGEPPKLTKPALEALAIIVFSEQHPTRSLIERIRGVDSDSVLNGLVARGLIEESGREDTVGRPIVYRITDTFKQLFGVREVSELKDELQKLLKVETTRIENTPIKNEEESSVTNQSDS